MGYFDDVRKPAERPALPDGIPLEPGRASRYAQKALEDECANVRTAAEGGRNHALNVAAFSIGQLVAAGHLTESHARAELEAAAAAAGLTALETDKTIGSGFRSGSKQPRQVTVRPAGDPVDVHALVGKGKPGEGADSQPEAREAIGLPDDSEVIGEEVATWKPLDLGDVLDGTYVPELPTLLPRDDGHCLLYPGRVHSFHGESESGKSLIAQAEAARLLSEGRPVLFVDFESDRAAVTGRMIELGADKEAIRSLFTYVRPEVDPRRFPHERAAVAELLGREYDLAVIDGVTESLGIFGYSTKDNDEVTAWLRVLPRQVASATGAAVVVIDHVTKDADSRGRFAIGGQAKMAGLDGAAYVIAMTDALGRGRRGEVMLRVAKDRPGGVRAHAGAFRKRDNTQEAARVSVDSTTPDGLIRVTFHAPDLDDDGHPSEWRPTMLMERVSLTVEAADQPLGLNEIKGLVQGNNEHIAQAIGVLVREHFIRLDTGARGKMLHSSIQPYREVSDPSVRPRS